MKNKECSYVEDLLPNYIECLTTPDTTHFIDEHLLSCKQCSIALNAMKKELPKGKIEMPKKQVNYLKKFRNKLLFVKLLFLGIFIVFYIFVAITLRKANILTLLAKQSSNHLSDNYYIEQQSFSFNRNFKSLNTSLASFKGYRFGNYLSGEYIFYDFNQSKNELKKTTSISLYHSPENIIERYDNSENSTYRNYSSLQESLIPVPSPLTFGSTNFFDNIATALSYHMNTESLNLYDDCFVFSNDYDKIYIEKSTGLVLKTDYSSHMTDYYYNFDIVTQENIVEPDISNSICIN